MCVICRAELRRRAPGDNSAVDRLWVRTRRSKRRGLEVKCTATCPEPGDYDLVVFAAPEGSPKLTSVLMYQLTARGHGVRPVRRTDAADRLCVRPAPACRHARVQLDDGGAANIVMLAPLNVQFFCEARLGEWRDRRVGTLRRCRGGDSACADTCRAGGSADLVGGKCGAECVCQWRRRTVVHTRSQL